jgi:hypothetical protein
LQDEEDGKSEQKTHGGGGVEVPKASMGLGVERRMVRIQQTHGESYRCTSTHTVCFGTRRREEIGEGAQKTQRGGGGGAAVHVHVQSAA